MSTHSRVVLTGFGGDPSLYPSQTCLLDLFASLQWDRLLAAIRQHVLMNGRLPPTYVRTSGVGGGWA